VPTRFLTTREKETTSRTTTATMGPSSSMASKNLTAESTMTNRLTRSSQVRPTWLRPASARTAIEATTATPIIIIMVSHPTGEAMDNMIDRDKREPILTTKSATKVATKALATKDKDITAIVADTKIDNRRAGSKDSRRATLSGVAISIIIIMAGTSKTIRVISPTTTHKDSSAISWTKTVISPMRAAIDSSGVTMTLKTPMVSTL